MANYCSTEITITCQSPEDAELLDRELSKASMLSKEEPGWLGSLLLSIGIPMDEITNADPQTRKWDVRGAIVYRNRDGRTLYLEIETKWHPMLKAILTFCRHHVKDFGFLYHCEEPGCDVFYTNEAGVEIWLDVTDDAKRELTDKQLQALCRLDNICTKADLESVLRSEPFWPDADDKSLWDLTTMLQEQAEDGVFIHAYEFKDPDQLD